MKRLRGLGPTVILSDGDVVFQPRKVERAGLSDAVDGRVLIYIHKEEALDDVERRYPAAHYVLVDDKLRILEAVKQVWEGGNDRVPRQGIYAHDPQVISAFPPADVTIERIGDLLDFDLPRLRTASRPLHPPEGEAMKPTKALHDLGQSLWLDNITRELLNSGTLQRYIDELSVTGLTSNPTIFDHAIKNSGTYDADISRRAPSAKSAEDLFFDLALADLTRAAELFQPVFARTDGVDGWVSLEVSPLLAHDTNSTLAAARNLHQRGGKPNLFIKIPGTAEGLPAIEAAIFAGVPVNVTLLFSQEQYVAAAEAYLRGVERRIEAGLNPAVASVASLFRQPLGRRGQWQGPRRADQPARHRSRPARLQGLSRVARFRALPARRQCRRSGPAPPLCQHRHQGPKASDILYVKALAAPFTVNTMPEGTLKAVADHGEVGEILTGRRRLRDGSGQLRPGGHRHRCAGRQLQDEGASSFVKSWNDLIACIDSKSAAIRKAS